MGTFKRKLLSPLFLFTPFYRKRKIEKMRKNIGISIPKLIVLKIYDDNLFICEFTWIYPYCMMIRLVVYKMLIDKFDNEP